MVVVAVLDEVFVTELEETVADLVEEVAESDEETDLDEEVLDVGREDVVRSGTGHIA